ncbi:MAG: hypothetical protein RLZZ385_588 [Pseudomonadota bacterium]|jgi:SM-20-related protein
MQTQSSLPVDTTAVFDLITQAVLQRGWCFIPDALPQDLCQALFLEAVQDSSRDFRPAGVGRQDDHQINRFVRRDQIRWIEGETPAQQCWLRWMDDLRLHLNRHLFLGLFSFESHFARYPVGAFYRKHVDAFRGDANRVLSTVLYLNPDWTTEDGGALVLYDSEDGGPGTAELGRFQPAFGSLAVFLSEAFPHEVQPTRRERYSIAGWYRVNSSSDQRVDPAR